jgi:hypothetical protein
VAPCLQGPGLLVGEAKLVVNPRDAAALLADLERRAAHVPGLEQPLTPVLFVLEVLPELAGHPQVIGPDAILAR